MGIPVHEAEPVLRAIREEFYEYVPPIAQNNRHVTEAICKSAYKVLDKIIACGWGPLKDKT